MKPSQLRWKWLLFGLLAVLIFVIALIPWLIGDTSRFGDRVAAELSAWTGGEVKFTGPVRVRFLPDVSVRGQIEIKDSKRLPAVQSLAAREAKVSLDLVDLVARPHHHRCAPAAQAANHLARQRNGRGGAGERATHLVHHAPRRRAGARAACAQRQDHASGRARRHHQGDLRASRRRQGNRRRLRVRLLRLQGLERALLAGERNGHRDGRRREFSGCPYPHLEALPREAERHRVEYRRLHDRRRHAGRDRRCAQILQMDRHPHSRTATV